MPENFLDDYPDRHTLAERLEVSWRTIARYENEPNGLPSLMLGGKRRYPWPEVLKWLEARIRRPNPRRRD